MRHWFLVLMIALLPLRGWVGEAMAGQMLAQQASAMQQALASDDAMTMAPGHGFDCHSHAAADGNDPRSAEEAHTACSQCQMCSSPALSLDTPVVLAGAVPHAHPWSAARSFASAPQRQALEPPIS